MEFIDLFLQNGIMGLVAGIFLWLYLDEKKAHKQTIKEKEALLEARRQDAKEVTATVTQPLEEIGQYTKLIYDKLLIGKRSS